MLPPAIIAAKAKLQKDGNTYYQLLAGKDPNKDQSYFLCQLTQAQFQKPYFLLVNY
jgi:tRNA-specific 2-thiouridylase